MRPAARLIDANANRAREALRVMEDIARFALDDAALSASLKTLRHDLHDALGALADAGLDRTLLLASRDTPGDVGTAIATPGERRRESLRDVALAAGSRLAEALRSIEETAKTLPPPHPHVPGAAARFESIRYRAYAAQQELGLALPSGRCPRWRLCVLITESLCNGRDWLGIARAAAEGGADCLQLREKDLDSRELLARARALVALTRATDFPGSAGKSVPRDGSPPKSPSVIINDRPDIALLAGADGVHVGQADLSVADIRRLAGDRLLVGVSTGNLDRARAAARDGADSLGLGPMFPTTTTHKPALAGPAFLAAVLADPILSQLPHLAIGGITPANVHQLAGVGGIAVSSAVCGAADPAAACRALLEGVR